MESPSEFREYLEQIAATVREERKNTPHHCVRILLRSTAETGKYEFVAKNTGERDLWNLYFDECEILSVDDTHMPTQATEWPPVKIAYLPAHSEASFFSISLTEKYPYRPPANRQFKLSYAFQQDGSQSGYAPALLMISSDVPVIRSAQPSHTQSYTALDTPTFNRLASFLISLFKKKK